MDRNEQVVDTSDTGLAALADGCLREADSDIMLAVDLMIERVQRNDSLYRRLHAPLTRGACLDWLKRSYADAQQRDAPVRRLSSAEEARIRARAEAMREAMEALRTRR